MIWPSSVIPLSCPLPECFARMRPFQLGWVMCCHGLHEPMAGSQRLGDPAKGSRLRRTEHGSHSPGGARHVQPVHWATMANGSVAKVVISNRTKSGGILRRPGSDRYAVLSDQGHHRGFRIQLFQDGQPLPIQSTRTQPGVLWKEACALADQLLLSGSFPDARLQLAAVEAAQKGTVRRSRPEKNGSNPQLSLLDAGWPAPERFPHNSRLTTVRTVVEADLLAAQNPLIVTGFVSLDSLLGLLARVHASNGVHHVRLLLGYEPYAAGKAVFRVGNQRYADEIADFWLEQGISLYLSGAVLAAIEILESGRADARISGEAGIVHAKMYRTERAVTIGSSNYSRPGLVEHIEANVRFAAADEPDRFEEAAAFADRVWEQGQEYTEGLIALLRQLLSAVTWQEALGRACAELLEGKWARGYQPVLLGDGPPLWPSQEQGLVQAMWVLENVGSVLVADATGSGKTRLGAHLLAAAMHRLVWGGGRTRRDMLPVLICPSAVLDVWRDAREECGFAAETYSDGLLSRGGQDIRAGIERTLRRAQVLAIDEAHRFLNRGASRTQRILFNNLADFVLLFTATPVNRGPRDLVSIVDLLGADNFEDDVLDILGRLARRHGDVNETMAQSERAVLQRAIQRFTVRRTKGQLNALIDASPGAYRDADGKPCRFPEHNAQLYPCGETERDREIARAIGQCASELLGLSLLQGELALTAAERADLFRRGETEQDYLDWRLLGARGLARHNVLAALRSSHAALVEHIRGTGFACAQLNLRTPKSNETGDVLGALDRLARHGPPTVNLNAVGPPWLHDREAYAVACARERQLYEQIDRLSAELSDARERAKVDLLVQLGQTHPVVLAFDSRLITLADLQRRIEAVTDHDVALATGSDAAGRRHVRRAAERGSAAKRLIALCSDTMAEGFNLQGASAVVHLDMPSVIRTAEQRAGRVDRLDSPHASIDVWWPQDADEFALRQDERFVDRYQFVADVLGANFAVPRPDGQVVRPDQMIGELAQQEREPTPWDGIADAFEPVRELIAGANSLVPHSVYAQMRTSRANVVSSVSAVQADKPWAFFAVAGTEWGAPQWVFFSELGASPTTDLLTISQDLRGLLTGRETRSWDDVAVTTQNAFLRELSVREPELLPRKKRRALEELRWTTERYRSAAITSGDDARIEVTRQLLGLIRPADIDQRAAEAQVGLFDGSAIDLHAPADAWLDFVRPIWYEHLREHPRT